MNVVDSSAWLEYFADGPNAEFFAQAIENETELVVPTISLYEVFKRVLQQRGEGDALQVVALMQQGKVVELTITLALSAAKISDSLKLPMADSIILATTRAYTSYFVISLEVRDARTSKASHYRRRYRRLQRCLSFGEAGLARRRCGGSGTAL